MIGQHNVMHYATEKSFENNDQASSSPSANVNWNVSFGDQK